MAMVRHAGTGFLVGDPEAPPFPEGYVPSPEGRARAMEGLILSASGWRKVFAADANEESFTEEVGLADREIAAAMGRVFADFLVERSGKASPCVVVGLDCRPTGPAIADVMVRSFLAKGLAVRYHFILPAPEIMAYAKSAPGVDGFAYVSASHNPVGHNGVKFGRKGGVAGGEESADLITAFKSLVADQEAMTELVRDVGKVPPDLVREVYERAASWKRDSEAAYEDFTRLVVSGREDAAARDELFSRLGKSIRARGCGIVAELNGSARTLGIDRRVLEGVGVRLEVVNGRPREIVHRIVPEGPSLDQCRAELEKARATDPAFAFGYVPDNDGDRGNIVCFDEAAGKARILEAQEVFALACVAELSHLAAEGVLAYDADGEPETKCAIAVNDPTSLRIDRIARVFGAKVFRAEVGEANVVSLAMKLRSEGWLVRILGEGSNGGNITHPAEVRDPLNTLFALLKLLYLEADRGRPSPLDVWLDRIGRRDLVGSRPGLAEIIATLPRFSTLSAYEPDALLRIRTQDHGLLKERYEAIFLGEWEKRKLELANSFGLVSWEEINYEGITARSGMGKAFRTGAQRGGLSLLLKDGSGETKAFIWMRGSGTEPVFRILVDLEGEDAALKDYLLAWHRSMILEADGGK